MRGTGRHTSLQKKPAQRLKQSFKLLSNKTKKTVFNNKTVFSFSLNDAKKQHNEQLKKSKNTPKEFDDFLDKKLSKLITSKDVKNKRGKLFSISISTESKKLDEYNLHSGRSTELRKFGKTSLKDSLQDYKNQVGEMVSFLARYKEEFEPAEFSRIKRLSKNKIFKVNIYPIPKQKTKNKNEKTTPKPTRKTTPKPTRKTKTKTKTRRRK